MLMKRDLFDMWPWALDHTPSFAPAFDVSEDETTITLEAELPGMTEKEITVQIDEGVLTVSGEKKFEFEKKEKNFHRVERSYGSFHRSFTLPETVDAEKVQANAKNGVLTITLPKIEAAKPKLIDVKVN